ncbi:MAG: YceI family protein [Flavobacteriaceae bacterium]
MKYLTQLITVFTLVIMSPALAQELDTEGSSVLVLGTSTLHDWEMNAEDIKGSLIMENDELQVIEFQAIVEGIKSGKSKMDKLAYKAFDYENNPNISFRAEEIDIDGENATLKGVLGIAGKSNEVSIPLKMTKNEAYLNFKGSYTLKMTDYGMTPPTAVFGTIKTGDEITVEFDLNYKQ